MDSDKQRNVVVCKCGYSSMWMEYDSYWKCAACGTRLEPKTSYNALDEKAETEIRLWSRLERA